MHRLAHETPDARLFVEPRCETTQMIWARPLAKQKEHDMTLDAGLAARSGVFKIGGEIEINRLGFGAMRITGRGIWGEPADRAEAIATLRRLPELGVNFIDTAESYGPHVSENLIREALHPYADGLLVATKGGLTRDGPDILGPRWPPGETDRRREIEPEASRR